jgi:hypothetical protein
VMGDGTEDAKSVPQVVAAAGSPLRRRRRTPDDASPKTTAPAVRSEDRDVGRGSSGSRSSRRLEGGGRPGDQNIK